MARKLIPMVKLSAMFWNILKQIQSVCLWVLLWYDKDELRGKDVIEESIRDIISILCTLAQNDRVTLYIICIPAETGEDKSGSKKMAHI